MNHPSVKIYSFDIFDTAVTRLVGNPKDLFLFLGKKVCQQLTINPQAFYHARIRAEQLACESLAPEGQPTLLDIYRQLGQLLNLPDELVQPMRQKEMDLESDLIRPVPSMVRRIDFVRREGARVIFASDMYLPADFLKKLLLDRGIAREKDPLYVSCEHKASKHSGELFKKILSVEGVCAKEVLHCGNDPIADVAVPKKMGILTDPFYEANLNRYEKLMEKMGLFTGGLSSRLAGASRYRRLCAGAADPRDLPENGGQASHP